jgi:flagellar assembly protein FliH
MSSRVFKSGTVESQAFHWRQAAPAVSEGVRPFPFRPAGQNGAVPTEPEPPPPPPPDLDAIRRTAFQEGLETGRAEGRKQAAAQFETKLVSLGQVVGQVLAYKRGLREEAEREVVDLAFAVARRILRREASLDPRMTLAMVRACLDELNGVEITKISVSPEDAEMVREGLGGRFEVVADSSIQRGGAVLATSQGDLDARIDSQLEELERGLADG